MCSTPDCFGIFAPEMVKDAVAPPFLPTVAAVLSRILRASAALSAHTVPNTKVKSVNMTSLFIFTVIIWFVIEMKEYTIA